MRDLRTDLRVLQPVLTVAARGLSRELAVSRPLGRAVLAGDHAYAPACAAVALHEKAHVPPVDAAISLEKVHS